MFCFEESFGLGFGRLIGALNEFESSLVLSKPQKPLDKIKQSNHNSVGAKIIAAFDIILLLASFQGLIVESIHRGS